MCVCVYVHVHREMKKNFLTTSKLQNFRSHLGKFLQLRS